MADNFKNAKNTILCAHCNKVMEDGNTGWVSFSTCDKCFKKEARLHIIDTELERAMIKH